MSADEAVNFVPANGRKRKLILDSEEEERIEAEEARRQDELILKKEEKRKRKEEEVRRAEEEAAAKLEKQRKYDDPAMMVVEDSDSEDEFRRVEEKIRKAYPEFSRVKDIVKKKPLSESVSEFKSEHSSESGSQSGSDSESDSQSESETPPKKKVQRKSVKEVKQISKKVERKEEKKREKKRKESVSEDSQGSDSSSEKGPRKVKIECYDQKQLLARDVAVRWWFCMPSWPPADYSYDQELRNAGYRLVEASSFKLEEDVVKGLTKVMPLTGFSGWFKSKTKLIDLRPKQTDPSMAYFRGRTVKELTDMLRVALQGQIGALKDKKYLQDCEKTLLTELERKLINIST